MSAPLEILRPFVTARHTDLVRQRLLEGLKFFEAGVLRPEFSRAEVKLTLLLVRLANPTETLNADEAALLSAPMRQQKVKPFSAEIKPASGQVKPRSPKRRKQGP